MATATGTDQFINEKVETKRMYITLNDTAYVLYVNEADKFVNYSQNEYLNQQSRTFRRLVNDSDYRLSRNLLITAIQRVKNAKFELPDYPLFSSNDEQDEISESGTVTETKKQTLSVYDSAALCKARIQHDMDALEGVLLQFTGKPLSEHAPEYILCVYIRMFATRRFSAIGDSPKGYELVTGLPKKNDTSLFMIW